MKPLITSTPTDSLLPDEMLLMLRERTDGITIGIPSETHLFEHRLALTPEAVAILCRQGHRVIVQTGAGASLHYADIAYAEAGASLTDSLPEVWSADIVVKVSIPTPGEVMLMRPRAMLLSFVQLRLLKPETLRMLLEKRITAIGYEFVADIKGEYPLINQIREIEGRTAIVIAADLLTTEGGGKGILLGGCAGVSPTEVVILGAGRSGSEAARTAMALGAMVKVFDDRIDRLRSAQRALGASLFTSTFHPNVLQNALRTADVVIGALHIEPGGRRFYLSADMIRLMKRGALLLDLSVDQGGCFETSIYPESPHEAFFEQHGVLHYCLPNISALVARTTSIALSNHLVPLLQTIAESGSIETALREHAELRKGAFTYSGRLVNTVVADWFGVASTDIMLFLTSLQ
jgi:alanine dehydrogenase